MGQETVSIPRGRAEACNGAGLGFERHSALVSLHHNFMMLQACAAEADDCLAVALITPLQKHVNNVHFVDLQVS